jgi:hypothetical protein
VGSWRRRYATDAADGMWAHVTLIYPFRESARLDAESSRSIASVLGRFASFTFTSTTAEYFKSPRLVLYLAAEPAAPFEAITRALTRAFSRPRDWSVGDSNS